MSIICLLPEIGKGRLTVGKIYGGLLILENWKATKFGKMQMSDIAVSERTIQIFVMRYLGNDCSITVTYGAMLNS